MQFVVKQNVGSEDHIVESDNTNSDAAVGYLTEPRSQPMVAIPLLEEELTNHLSIKRVYLRLYQWYCCKPSITKSR